MINLENVKYAVEANSFESMCLWQDWQDKVKWESKLAGSGVTVEGCVDSFVSLLITKINGVDVLFYEATSVLVDHTAVERWIMINCPLLTTHRMTNSMNFHNIVHSIERGDK